MHKLSFRKSGRLSGKTFHKMSFGVDAMRLGSTRTKRQGLSLLLFINRESLL